MRCKTKCELPTEGWEARSKESESERMECGDFKTFPSTTPSSTYPCRSKQI